MARKNFKSDLGELITNSNIDINSEQETSGNNDKLIAVIAQLKQELHLWRTGKLTVEHFEKSLEKYHLKYDATTNTFSKI